MRALIQRTSNASVDIDGVTAGKATGAGLMILLCAMEGDTKAEAEFLAGKISKLRIFPDENNKPNLSVKDIGGSALAISQFTLSANWKKGNRPSYITAAEPELASNLYDYFCEQLILAGVPCEKGVFGASMQVSLINDGPFTIWMDTNDA